MPVVPTARPATTALRALPGERYRAEASPDQFGEPVGRGLQQAARVAFDVYRSEMDRQNEARVNEARNAEAAATIADRQRLDAARGKDADTVLQDLAEQRRRRIAETEAKLSNANQKDAFRTWAQREDLDFLARGTEHVAREGERYADEQHTASVQLGVERIAQERQDYARVGQIRTEIEQGIQRHGQLRGWPPEVIQAKVAEFRKASVLRAAGTSLDAGDIRDARGRIETARQDGSLSDADAAQALAKIDAAERDTTAQRAADRLFLVGDLDQGDLAGLIAGKDDRLDPDTKAWIAKDPANRDEFVRRAGQAMRLRDDARDAQDERDVMGLLQGVEQGQVPDQGQLNALSPRARALFDKHRSKTFEPIEQEAIRQDFLSSAGRALIAQRDPRAELLSGRISRETFQVLVDYQRKIKANDVPTVDDAIKRDLIHDTLDSAAESLQLGATWPSIKKKLDKGDRLSEDERRYVTAAQEVYNALAISSQEGSRKIQPEDVRRAVGSLLQKQTRWTSTTEKTEMTGLQAIDEARASWPDGYEQRARDALVRQGVRYPTTTDLDMVIKQMQQAEQAKPAAAKAAAMPPDAATNLRIQQMIDDQTTFGGPGFLAPLFQD